MSQLDSWQEELAQDINLGFKRGYFQRLQNICADMQSDSRFGRYQSMCRYILHHWGLEPRNILVQREDEGTQSNWRISPVLDWDEALSVPAILARKPPLWLWDASYDHSSASQPDGFDGDADLLPPDHYSELSGDAQRIKQHFEASFADKVLSISGIATMKTYVDEAYGTGRWIRRLWDFAKHGFGSNEDVNRLENLEREWSQYHPSVDTNVSVDRGS